MEKQLMEFWKETLRCDYCDSCNIKNRQKPQFLPVGERYRPGGVVFVQINPGSIGTKAESDICDDYKSPQNQKIALLKVKTTQNLLDIQEKFIESPSIENWGILCREYSTAMRYIWGWRPGKYAKTIEEHGVKFDSVSIVNIAQCPIKNDAYNKRFLNTCWEHRTSHLLKILKPKIIVAQGKTVFDYLETKLNSNEFKILLGVHHASRASTKEKDLLLRKVKTQLNG